METNFGKIIKQKRRSLGLNQKEFSERIGLGLATVRDIEQGKTTVKLSNFLTVVDALGLELKIEDDD